MNIRIIAVGKIKEKYLQQGIAEYLKRLSAYAKVEIIEVPDEKAPEKISAAQAEQIKEREGEKIARFIREDSFLIALAIDGGRFSSEKLAQYIADLGLKGKSDLTLLIGGSLGLSQALLERCDFKLSFSAMTFPHQLMRLILLEQIYRCFKINKGEPYHK